MESEGIPGQRIIVESNWSGNNPTTLNDQMDS